LFVDNEGERTYKAAIFDEAVENVASGLASCAEEED